MSKAKYYEGQKVRGHIMNVTKEAIYVEIDQDQEEGVKGILYANDVEGHVEGRALSNDYNTGEEIEAYVKQVSRDNKSKEPLYILSTTYKTKQEELQIFDELKEKDEIISVKVVRVTSAGADLKYKNLDAKIFLPIKNSDLSEGALKAMKGETIDVIVLNVNYERLSVIVSQTIAERKKHRLAKEAAYAALEVGQVVEGEVVSVLQYGAIVSLGEVSGLLHQSEIDHKLVRKVSDRLHVGDKVTVKIIGLEDNKIALSIRALSQHPWEVLKEQYHVGDVFEGTVTKVIPAGLIIKLTDDYSGLMPKFEYSWIIGESSEGKVQEGDTILVKVTAIDDEKKRVSLSHRQTIENVWAKVACKKGDVIKVVIASIEEKGAKVSYLDVTGFLPIHEVTNTRRLGKVDEFFEVGQEVDAMVIDCNPGKAKLVVSTKALETKKERDSYDKYVAQQAKETPKSTIGDILEEQAAEKAAKSKGRK